MRQACPACPRLLSCTTNLRHTEQGRSSVAALECCRAARAEGHLAQAGARLHAQTYLLKLARSGDDGEKVFLLLESGARFHTTQAGRASCAARAAPARSQQ
jgi:hypothetical protein